MRNEPKVQIGILFESKIEFSFLTSYQMGGKEIFGTQTALYDNGKIEWQGELYDELGFQPADESVGKFELKNVTIGVNFHWERKEDQCFRGALKIIVEGGKLTAINTIGVEDYLTSVISSEMSATASLELLKAHAVISRSWLLAQMDNDNLPSGSSPLCEKTQSQTEEIEAIRWYDRSSHFHFDVCADDHCQRYQGITHSSAEIVRQAVATTRGQVLRFEGKICDTRFSKCCGGAFEEFQYCWENTPHPYLSKQRDSLSKIELSDLRTETEAEKWIRAAPEAFCHTTDKHILSQVLNRYDQETIDFYRWKVEYAQEELSELIFSRSGMDFGSICDMIPVERGTSARLSKLKIVGSKRTRIIGKELEIRRTLSPSHLYSSAFVIDKMDVKNGIPGRFILTGAGWGHGVGLCQIGAAVMGEQGYTYKDILLHYYIGAGINKIYE
jgi:SpoIID/LytB domain protein